MAGEKKQNRPPFKVNGETADIHKMFEQFRDKYQSDIVAFVEEFLEKKPTREQKRLLKAVVKTDKKTGLPVVRRIARATGHSVGKSTAVTWIALHQILFVKDIRIMLLASQEDQARQSLFDQILGFADRKDTPEQILKSDFLKSMLKMTGAEIVPWDNPNKSSISVKSPSRSNTQSVAGIRGDGKTLIICDEASLIDDEVYAALNGVMGTPSTQIILTGNPLYATGYFYRVFHEYPNWDTEHWSSETHTHTYCVSHRLPMCERLVDDDWLAQQKVELSESQYQSRILGQFPTDTQSSLVSPRVLDECNKFVADTEGAIIWALDLSGQGTDKTIFTLRRGNHIEDFFALPSDAQTSRWVYERFNQAKPGEKPDAIFYDLTGVGQTFKEAVTNIGGGDRLPLKGVNFGGNDYLVEPDKFYNNKSEIFWRFKTLLENKEVSFSDKIDKTNWKLFRDEALAHNFDVTEKGKTAICKKEKVRAKLKQRSPDRMDSVALAFSKPKVMKKNRDARPSNRPTYRAPY